MNRLSNAYLIFMSAPLFIGVIFAFAPVAHAISIDAIISDQSTQVAAGDRLYFEIDIKYPENTTRQDLRVNYQIKEGGQVIASEQVLRAVETQASFLDYIVVPKSAQGGIHELDATISGYSGTLDQTVSATFMVTGGIDKITMYFFIIIGVIIFVALLVVIQIALDRRTMRRLEH